MIVTELVNKLMQYVREGESCSCPIIMQNGNKFEVAVFTYYASDELPVTVFGYGQLIKTDGERIIAEELESFQEESELIIINNIPKVCAEVHKMMYDEYYKELQKAVNSIANAGEIDNIVSFSKAFMRLVPNEAMELYRRICPDFVELINN